MRSFVLFAGVAFGSLSVENGSRQRMVDEINSMPGVTWKAGFSPRFATGSMADLLGVLPNNKQHLIEAIDRGDVKMVHATENFAPPDSFDSETNWPACASIIGDITDQSNCGCCWAFGPSGAASDRMCIATMAKDLSLTLSPQDLCFCSSSSGCGGGFPDSAWSYIQRTGIVTGGQYNNTEGPTKNLCSAFSLPHCHHHGPQGSDPYPDEGSAGCPSQSSPRCPKACDSAASAPHNVFATDKYKYTGTISTYSTEAAIQQAIMTDGPIAAAFTVYADFENYVSGVYKHVTGSAVGGHAVRIVGWGLDGTVKYWKIANSWNPYWGEKGYFRMIRGTNEGGIEDECTSSSTGAKWVGPTL